MAMRRSVGGCPAGNAKSRNCSKHSAGNAQRRDEATPMNGTKQPSYPVGKPAFRGEATWVAGVWGKATGAAAAAAAAGTRRAALRTADTHESIAGRVKYMSGDNSSLYTVGSARWCKCHECSIRARLSSRTPVTQSRLGNRPNSDHVSHTKNRQNQAARAIVFHLHPSFLP